MELQSGVASLSKSSNIRMPAESRRGNYSVCGGLNQKSCHYKPCREFVSGSGPSDMLFSIHVGVLANHILPQQLQEGMSTVCFSCLLAYTVCSFCFPVNESLGWVESSMCCVGRKQLCPENFQDGHLQITTICVVSSLIRRRVAFKGRLTLFKNAACSVRLVVSTSESRSGRRQAFQGCQCRVSAKFRFKLRVTCCHSTSPWTLRLCFFFWVVRAHSVSHTMAAREGSEPAVVCWISTAEYRAVDVSRSLRDYLSNLKY